MIWFLHDERAHMLQTNVTSAVPFECVPESQEVLESTGDTSGHSPYTGPRPPLSRWTLLFTCAGDLYCPKSLFFYLALNVAKLLHSDGSALSSHFFQLWHRIVGHCVYGHWYWWHIFSKDRKLILLLSLSISMTENVSAWLTAKGTFLYAVESRNLQFCCC